MARIVEEYGRTCLLYGGSIMLLAIALVSVSTFFNILSFRLNLYLIISILATLTIFGFRTFNYGREMTFSHHETMAALLSAIGLSILVAPLGFMMVISSRTDYESMENWFPNIKNPENELQKYIGQLELSSETHARALEILERMQDKNLFSGREVEHMVSGIVYIAAKAQKEPRTLDEIANVSGADKKGIGKAYRSIGRDLGISIMPPDPKDFLERFGNKLGLSESVIENAEEIVGGAKEKNLTSGKSPKSIAASAIYLAAYGRGEPRNLNEVADVLDITTVTIRNRSKELIIELGIEDYPENLEEGLRQ